MKQPERELPFAAAAFNLINERGDDPLRVILDRLHDAEAKAAAEEYQLKMQRTFAECPGFIGGDAPRSSVSTGYVIVEPGKALEAQAWLKKRFHVNKSFEIDQAAGGLRIEVLPRERSKSQRKQKIHWGPPEQFNLNL